MANADHIELVKQGAEAIAAWREAHPNERLDLQKADLDGLNLRRANLQGANLQEARLQEADLQGMVLGNTTFDHTNVNRAHGLETCRHQGASRLDLGTLSQSGILPDTFLRGGGWPEELISAPKG